MKESYQTRNKNILVLDVFIEILIGTKEIEITWIRWLPFEANIASNLVIPLF